MSHAVSHEPVLGKFPGVAWDEAAGALIVPAAQAIAVALWLRDDDAFALDYCSNVTGVDYLDREV